MDDSSECKLQNFYFANLNSDFHKKWLIFTSNMNIKNDTTKKNLVLKGTPYVKMCNVLRKNC